MNLLHLHPSLVSYSCLFGVASTHPPPFYLEIWFHLGKIFSDPPPLPNNFVTYFLKPKFKSITKSDLFQGSGPPEKIARLLSLVMDPFVGCNSSLSQVMISAHWRLKIMEEPWVFPLHWREKPFIKYFAVYYWLISKEGNRVLLRTTGDTASVLERGKVGITSTIT